MVKTQDIAMALTTRLCEAWGGPQFCEDYAATWEISTEDVHYGWLAPGEDTLQLLQDIRIGANVLDAGCGMGQNLIALANRGANAYGVDLSPYMLEKAWPLAWSAAPSFSVQFAHEDMRILRAFPDVSFDLILSAYSLEYVASLEEFKATIHRFYQRLNPGGVFIMCFSHPSQLRRHHTLINRSLPVSPDPTAIFNYSIPDAVATLAKTGFSVERVIEQSTLNPSLISYEEGKKFPYHFREGCNPCDAKYDDISNASPHTIIYKARKPNAPTHGVSTRLDVGRATRKIWGSRRTIRRKESFDFLGRRYIAQAFAPIDNVEGICDVLRFTVHTSQLRASQLATSLRVSRDDETIDVSSTSVLGVIHQELLRRNLTPIYKPFPILGSNGNTTTRPLLTSIIGLEDELRRVFPGCALGLLVFLNGNEPCAGEIPTEAVQAGLGDKVTVSFVAIRRRGMRSSPQLTLV
jgi:SAM-dependent methyltransferase